MSPFYDFLVDCWKKDLVDEGKLNSFVPIFITDDECQKILATPK